MLRPAAAILAIGAALSAPALAAGTVAGEQLIEAAQRQEIQTVRRLLAAGVDVGSRSRYGATALFFACDKGNVELVELLLDHGAGVDVHDSFYDATPLTWTLSSVAESPPHQEIALLLLARGAAGTAAALHAVVETGDLELVEAAVEDGRLEPAALFSALKLAESSAEREIADYLRARAPAAVARRLVPPETLAAFAGDYVNEGAGLRSRVSVDAGELKVETAGQEALILDAVGADLFIARELPGVTFSFSGRGGTVERLRVRQSGEDLYFRRAESEERAPDAAAPLAPLAAPRRGEPIPWPRFRGAGAAGIGDGQGAPGEWDGASGRNVRWKTPIPGLAHSSPVIWGDRVFVTTAITRRGDQSLRTGLYGDVSSVEERSRRKWVVYALDRHSGEILWQRTASRGRPKAKRHPKSTHANPTPATDGEHLVVSFGSAGLFCYDLDGRRRWKKKLGALASGWFYDATYEWGFASSPIVHDGSAIVQVDVAEGSFIAAYDLASGREVWKRRREEISTWGTPAVLPAGAGGNDEIVTNGPTVRGYDAATGEELWRLGPSSEITVASPVVAGGVAYVTGGYPPVRPIYALVPGGRGDLSLPVGETASEHVLWSQPRGGAYIPTPIVYQGILYVLHNNGRLTAHDALTGELLYRQRVGGAEGFSSSPVAADGRLYFTSEEGTTYVVRAGRAFEVLASNELGETVMATPAISDGLLVIRGVSHVYGLGEPAE